LSEGEEHKREWPVWCAGLEAQGWRIDLGGLAQDREQLWAEAVIAASTEESLELDSELWADHAEAVKARIAVDPVMEVWRGKLQRVQGEWGELDGARGQSQYVKAITYTSLATYLEITHPQFGGRAMMGNSLRLVMSELGWNRPELVTFKSEKRARAFWRKPTADEQKNKPKSGAGLGEMDAKIDDGIM
jgi:hypothetical protein